MSQPNNIFYAHSGGVTAVINATACGLIETARQHSDKLGKVYAGRYGILGALNEDLIDTSQESDAAIAALRHTPGSAFGSCRYKLKSLEANAAEYDRLIEVFSAHHIGYFFYNGGNDSQDTAHKVAQLAKQRNYPLTCIGLPKTVDNDLPVTDNCPGFGSVAKYVAVSIKEAGLDVQSMAKSSTKVFILEVMGRHAGWIAAAGGLAAETAADAPHLMLFPEIAFDPETFLAEVDQAVKRYGFCAIVASEGLKNKAGQFLAEGGLSDAFGHKQLGGVAPVLAEQVKAALGYKYHWAVSDYLQRSARHIASRCDVEQAYAIGKAAIEVALAGESGVMLTIHRDTSTPYRWSIGSVALEKVANVERKLPREFITENGFHITPACRDYLMPLIEGEDYPPYHNGLPQYATLKNIAVPKKRLENVSA